MHAEPPYAHKKGGKALKQPLMTDQVNTKSTSFNNWKKSSILFNGVCEATEFLTLKNTTLQMIM